MVRLQICDLPVTFVFGVVFQLDHTLPDNWVRTIIWLLVIVELSEMLSNLSDTLIVVILVAILDLTIVLIEAKPLVVV